MKSSIKKLAKMYYPWKYYTKWKLFGHVLRSNQDTPVQKAMDYYFKNSNSKKFRRTPISTLPSSLHNDIIMRMKNIKQNNKYNNTQLKSIDDFENLRSLGKDRKTWSTLVTDVHGAAKAENNL